MADPRLAVSYDGIGALYASFLADGVAITYDATEDGGSAQVGLAVTLSDDNDVTLVGDAEPVLGKLIKVEPDGVCTVQIGGCMTLPAGDSADVTHGKKIIGDLGADNAEGYIRDALATDQNEGEIAAGRGMIFDASTTTAVWVKL